MKKIPYQTLTIECMSSYAGVVPPFSVIRPLHSFPLSFVRWLWRVMCCEMFMHPAVQVYKAWRRISAACELKREIPLIFHTQTHFSFHWTLHKAFAKAHSQINPDIWFYCHFTKMIHSVYFFSFMILKLESTLNVLLFIVPSSSAVKTQWKHFCDWIIPHEWIFSCGYGVMSVPLS